MEGGCEGGSVGGGSEGGSEVVVEGGCEGGSVVGSKGAPVGSPGAVGIVTSEEVGFPVVSLAEDSVVVTVSKVDMKCEANPGGNVAISPLTGRDMFLSWAMLACIEQVNIRALVQGNAGD